MAKMYPGRFWRSSWNNGMSRQWFWRIDLRRLAVCVRVIRHGNTNPNLGDRWVVEPAVIFDRKAA